MAETWIDDARERWYDSRPQPRDTMDRLFIVAEFAQAYVQRMAQTTPREEWGWELRDLAEAVEWEG